MKGQEVTKFITMAKLCEYSGLHHQTIKDMLAGKGKAKLETIRKLRQGLEQAERELMLALKDVKHFKNTIR